MLCKTTMRAALAPVIGLFGVLFAMSVGAQMVLTDTGDDAPDALAYAAESLHEDHSDEVAGITFYRLNATGMELVINAEIPLALPTSGGTYYVRYDFSGDAGLTREITVDDFDANVDDQAGSPTGAAPSVPAGGRAGDDFVVFEMPGGSNYARDNVVGLDLSLTSTARSDHDDDAATPDAYAMPWLAVAPRGANNIKVKASVYNDYFDAVNANGSIFTTPEPTLVSFTRAVTGSIASKFDVANVSTTVEDGGPFRRFVDVEESGGKDSGVLGTTTVSVNGMLRDAGAGQGLEASSGMITDAIVMSTSVVVTSDAGNFAVSLGEGGTVNKMAGGGSPGCLRTTPGARTAL